MTSKNNLKIELIIRTASNPIYVDFNELTKNWLASNSRIFSDGVLSYSISNNKLKIFLQSENLKNSQIRYYNITYGLDIPENTETDAIDEFDAYDVPKYMYI